MQNTFFSRDIVSVSADNFAHGSVLVQGRRGARYLSPREGCKVGEVVSFHINAVSRLSEIEFTDSFEGELPRATDRHSMNYEAKFPHSSRLSEGRREGPHHHRTLCRAEGETSDLKKQCHSSLVRSARGGGGKGEGGSECFRPQVASPLLLFLVLGAAVAAASFGSVGRDAASQPFANVGLASRAKKKMFGDNRRASRSSLLRRRRHNKT